MEYLLQLEEKQRYWLLGIGITVYICLMVLGSLFFGWYSFAVFGIILLFVLITPFLINKYKFFVYLWLFGLQLGLVTYHFFNFSIGEKNPVIFFITGLSVPFAIILFYRDVTRVSKAFPYINYLIFFDILILVNLFRREIDLYTWFEHFRFVSIGIFIIMCTYFFIKKNNKKEIFNAYAIWTLANSITAFFQKITGHGLMMLENYPRAPGLTGHPNGLGGTIIIYLILFYYFMKITENKRLRQFYIFIALFSILALFLSLNKQSILHLIIVLGFIFYDLSRKNKVKIIYYFPIIVLLFVTLDHLLNLNFINNIISRFHNQTSLYWRFRQWDLVLSQFDFKTILMGKGVGVIRQYLLTVNPENTPNIHSGFLELIGSYGILGLSYLLFNVHIIYYSFKELLKKHNKEIRDLLKFILLLSITNFLRVNGDQALWTRQIIYPTFFFITVAYLEIKNYYETTKI